MAKNYVLLLYQRTWLELGLSLSTFYNNDLIHKPNLLYSALASEASQLTNFIAVESKSQIVQANGSLLSYRVIKLTTFTKNKITFAVYVNH